MTYLLYLTVRVFDIDIIKSIAIALLIDCFCQGRSLPNTTQAFRNLRASQTIGGPPTTILGPRLLGPFVE